MKFKAIVGEFNRITVKHKVAKKLDIKPGVAVEVDIKNLDNNEK